MKKIHYLILGAAMVIMGSCSFSRNYAQNDYYTPGGGVTYQQFYDELSPYGNWIYNTQYGYVWSPFERGFHPYSTNGRWVYTSFGWTWKSNYKWGWAPFHYGRWTYDNFYGWIWVPGYEWAPAWVVWGNSPGYYGWAPLGPGMNINIHINMIPNRNWCFVPSRYINSANLGKHYVRNSHNVTIINNTTIINNNYYDNSTNRTYNAGPRVTEVERQTHQRIAPVRVVNRTTPGTSEIRNNEIAIYRPVVKQTDLSEVKPKKVLDAPVRKFDRDVEKEPSIKDADRGIINPQKREIDNPIKNDKGIINPPKREIDEPVRNDRNNSRVFPDRKTNVDEAVRKQYPVRRNPDLDIQRNGGTFEKTTPVDRRINNREITPRTNSNTRVFPNEASKKAPTPPARTTVPDMKARPAQKVQPTPPVRQVEQKTNQTQTNVRTFRKN
ncbi:MAG: hypothetical protein J5I50_08235 [Chitinophagaceae bacterium]|nr:hypothetical protein [Chitinophagaceae bacterium]